MIFVRREFRSGAISGIGSNGEGGLDDDDGDEEDEDDVAGVDIGSGECGCGGCDDDDDVALEEGGGGVNPDWTADTAAAQADWRLGLLAHIDRDGDGEALISPVIHR